MNFRYWFTFAGPVRPTAPSSLSYLCHIDSIFVNNTRRHIFLDLGAVNRNSVNYVVNMVSQRTILANFLGTLHSTAWTWFQEVFSFTWYQRQCKHGKQQSIVLLFSNFFFAFSRERPLDHHSNNILVSCGYLYYIGTVFVHASFETLGKSPNIQYIEQKNLAASS